MRIGRGAAFAGVNHRASSEETGSGIVNLSVGCDRVIFRGSVGVPPALGVNELAMAISKDGAGACQPVTIQFVGSIFVVEASVSLQALNDDKDARRTRNSTGGIVN